MGFRSIEEDNMDIFRGVTDELSYRSSHKAGLANDKLYDLLSEKVDKNQDQAFQEALPRFEENPDVEGEWSNNDILEASLKTQNLLKLAKWIQASRPSDAKEHYIEKCKKCDCTISQCRCKGDKKVIKGICDKCKKEKGKKKASDFSSNTQNLLRLAQHLEPIVEETPKHELDSEPSWIDDVLKDK
jgi:hypothetical protein